MFYKCEDVLFSPEKRVCCGRDKIDETSPFCDLCKSKIKLISGKVCDKCGRPINVGKVCDKCKGEKFYFDKARAYVVYDEISRPMITKFKYSNARFLKDRLSDMLVKCFADNDELKADIITFVPISKKKLKSRGFNQTEILANEFCNKTNLKILNLLIKIKETPAQAGLNKEERIKNLKGSFEFDKEHREAVKDKNILLIDDVFTTGSTVNECAKLLKNAGASGVFVLTIAKT